MQIPAHRQVAANAPGPVRATMEEERQEALEGVLEAMATEDPDSSRAAACSYLLRHLTGRCGLRRPWLTMRR